MHRRAVPCLLAAAGSVAAALAIAQGVVFRDTKGNMVLQGLSSWKATRIDEKTIEFEGAGSPFVGSWKEQELQLRAGSVKGQAVRQKTGEMKLISGTIAKGVVFESKREQTATTLRGEAIQYTAGTETDTVKLSSGIAATSINAAAKRTMKFDGSSGTVTTPPLDSKADWLIRTATVSGPVNFSLQTADSTISCKAASLTYNDATRTVILVGPLTMKGDDPVFSGEAIADKATILLDEKRNLKEVLLEGNPGRAVVSQKPKPGQARH